MSNLSQILADSNWGQESARINQNFQNLNADLEKVKSATTKFKGYFTSETGLKSKYPSPQVEDTAWVGETYPGTVYDVQVAGSWHNTGKAPDTGSVDLQDYAKKAELTELDNRIEYEENSLSILGAGGANAFLKFAIRANVKYYITVTTIGSGFSLSTKNSAGNENIESIANYDKPTNKEFTFIATKDAEGLGIYIKGVSSEDESSLYIKKNSINEETNIINEQLLSLDNKATTIDNAVKTIDSERSSSVNYAVFTANSQSGLFSYNFKTGKQYRILCTSEEFKGQKVISISTKDSDNNNLETIDNYETNVGSVINFSPKFDSTSFGIWIKNAISKDFNIFITESFESDNICRRIINDTIKKSTKIPLNLTTNTDASYNFKANYIYDICISSNELSGKIFSISSKINSKNVESIAEYNYEFNQHFIFKPSINANSIGIYTKTAPSKEGAEIIITEIRNSIEGRINNLESQKTYQKTSNARPVIFDTDLAWDVDDVVATRILAWGVRTKQIRLLGVNLSKVNSKSVSAMDGLLCEEGLNDIPISKGSVGGTERQYHTILSDYPMHNLTSNDDAISPITLYRKCLTELNEGEKADIIIVGVLTDFSNFLNSNPDSISGLTGIQIASEKINRVWVMGGNYDSGSPEANFREQPTATINVLTKCPVPIILQGSEIAEKPQALNCGKTLNEVMGDEDYVYQCLQTWSEEVSHWVIAYDPMLTLAAVDGNEYITQLKLERGTVTYNSESKTTEFTPKSDGNHYVTRKIMTNDYYSKRLDFILNKFNW